MKLTINKVFSDIPFAHRQHNHIGHCQYLHGHNFSFDVEFSASGLDENGFIIDFGRLQFLKDYINNNLDHALVLSSEDPILKTEAMQWVKDGLIKLYVVPSCSAEGLAQHLQDVFDRLVREQTGGRVYVSSVTVYEDSKNKATYSL